MKFSSPDFRKQITGHFIQHWGVPREIHVRSTQSMELAILEFGPQSRAEHFRFACNGMSSRMEECEGTQIGAELYLTSLSNENWIVDFLATLAEYPLLNDTSFSEYDTLPLEGLLHPDSPFSALLLTPKMPSEPLMFGSISVSPTELISILQVVGIFGDEYEFALEMGGEKLWNRLTALHIPLLIDQKRRVANLTP